MVEDVFGDPTEQPKACEADDQPHREVEPQILSGREPGDREPPGARIPLPEPPEPRRREDALPERLCARGHPGGVPPEPAPRERERYDQGHEQRAGQAGPTHGALELR